MNDSIREAISGALAGAASKTVTAPLDRLKLVVQLRGSIVQTPKSSQLSKADKFSQGSADIQKSYQGPWRALSKIVREEGFFALWRGNLPTIIAQGGNSALNFMFMDLYKKTARQLVSSEDHKLLQSFVSGGLAGGTANMILYPVGLMRTKLALDMGRGKMDRLYGGMTDVLRHSYQVNGFTGLYKGFSVALISVSMYRMVHLGGYDYIKSELNRRNKNNQLRQTQQISLYERMMAAQAVSMTASTVHYPFDSVRRRLMMQADIPQKDQKYINARHCFVQIYRDEGFAGYFRGLGTNYIRSVGAALVLVSYDFFKSVLS